MMESDTDMSTRHFILTSNGNIEEFSDAEASAVAEGTQYIPRFADERLRYVQVAFDERANDNGEIRVQTMGAIVHFDADGQLTDADRTDEDSAELTSFEHDACVQFALKETVGQQHAIN
ncbi:hypothetical protein HKX42_02980 [Salinisphaera sp. USBA-960]|uniref:hypothetical protein n=1 Tax=Salinisphaera orenii TaxID=856731 RepID=UPI000DBEA1B2|nr:hypothetical protein [Salifodinibacter halophilus]NNC25841.1 hypothetical protein [Salifodinibacter halophilus]